MALIPDEEIRMLSQLAKDGWYVVDMHQFESKIFDIVKWCRENIGTMMSNYDLDWNCDWHGGIIQGGDGIRTIFAFRDERDYTALTLRWA